MPSRRLRGPVECLDEDAVLAFVDGKVAEAESEAIAGHLGN